MKTDFFPPRPAVTPTIYAYELVGVTTHHGLLKIGYTERDVHTRIKEQLGTAAIPYQLVFTASAMRHDGSVFNDHAIHRYLRQHGFLNPDGEWFACQVADVAAAVDAIKTGRDYSEHRRFHFTMRPEQAAAVNKTINYFTHAKHENPNKTPHFLWNAKMRFGKTFAAYQLARQMGWRKILILTFKPAVQSAWQDDLLHHVDFIGWQFITNKQPELNTIASNSTQPLVCFGSFQDFLGKNPRTGGIKTKNEWVHTSNWDCVIFDEYHYGAWRERAKELFDAEDAKEMTSATGADWDYFDESVLPITTAHYLYLSGTPFRAIAAGEFIEEQIFNWTYADEQKAKADWRGPDNPYAALPRMVLLTYQLPESIRAVASSGELNEFDLNVFFSATGDGSAASFQYADAVQQWLNLIRGADLATNFAAFNSAATPPPLPFSHLPLLRVLNHTVWFLPSVAACHAMANLLQQRHNQFYHDYTVIIAAGAAAGIGVAALTPVLTAMTDAPLRTKTITLTCGKLTTGVSIKPWSGLLMLRNLSSPETYFQAAFRVQTPWTIPAPAGEQSDNELILKPECYVFDFAPNRALRQIADYSCRLNVTDNNPEAKVAEFIRFLPVLAYDGFSMKPIDAAGILELAMSGTTATLLARRWESALLVNVDNDTLARLLANDKALQALKNIEGLRSLQQDLAIIINRSEAVKQARRAANDGELTAAENKILKEQEKEHQTLRKQLQEKLIKLATRIPLFMYLTDYREHSLQDVIAQLEPGLFQRVTGLTVADFELLVHLDVFNAALMNDAIYKFKRYEDSSLAYLPELNKYADNDVGLYDTVITAADALLLVNEAAG